MKRREFITLLGGIMMVQPLQLTRSSRQNVSAYSPRALPTR